MAGDTAKKSRKEKAKPLVVRIPEATRGELQALGKRFDLSEAQLVRWAVEGMLDKVEREGGRIQLPFSFEDDATPS